MANVPGWALDFGILMQRANGREPGAVPAIARFDVRGLPQKYSNATVPPFEKFRRGFHSTAVRKLVSGNFLACTGHGIASAQSIGSRFDDQVARWCRRLRGLICRRREPNEVVAYRCFSPTLTNHPILVRCG